MRKFIGGAAKADRARGGDIGLKNNGIIRFEVPVA